MRQKRLLLLLVLLLTAATGAWATDGVKLTTAELVPTAAWNGNENDLALSDMPGLTADGLTEDQAKAWADVPKSGKVELIYGYVEHETYMDFKIIIFKDGVFISSLTLGRTYDAVYYYYTDNTKTYYATGVAAPAGYTVSLKDGVKDADKWTISPNPAEEGQTVTLQYTGRLKVKSVTAVKPAAWDGTITAQLAAKLAYTRGDATDDLTTMTWAVGEHIAILYKVSGTKKVADAEITAVDGTTGAATITFKVEDGTPDNTACTLVYPYSAAKDDHTGVKDAATLLAAQDGTLSANLDVRVGAGTIQTTTPGLTVTTQPAAQFAIFKFTTKNANGSATIDVTKLTITIGAQNYVITPALATSELYVALPPVSDQAVRFSATGSDSKTYTCSKASVTFAAGKYYQSTLKMALPITVTWNNDDITGSGNSFTKGGVTLTAGSIDFDDKSFEENGTFTTTLGNFTKIEVVATNGSCDVSGTGWSGNEDKRTWTGNASSVSFIGDIYGDGNGIKFVFTIEP